MPTNEHEHGRLEMEHLLRFPGLRRQAAALLIERQPKSVREALRIPGIGRSTTGRLLARGLLDDPEGVQGSDLPPTGERSSRRRPPAKPAKHRWRFVARFGRKFGWRSKPAVQRVREAVSEIVKEARRDPIVAADGAVLFLEKVAAAIEHVDGSSGAMGTAVNRAIDALVPIIVRAPASEQVRAVWLDRLWAAISEDEMPYLERLDEWWGELCAHPQLASAWADRLQPMVELAWSPDRRLRGYFRGTSACLSALLAGGRYEELLLLLEKAPHVFWHDRKYGVRALVAMGRKAEALRYAEASRGLNDSPFEIERACEEILLSSGLREEAYRRHAFGSNLGTSHLATYRALVKKYPDKEPAAILRDLVSASPGAEGKWFAAAKEAGFFDEAIALAKLSPCDPRTLTRAARDLARTHPQFALEAGMAALHWLVQGYGFDITSADVWAAFRSTMLAAEQIGCSDETRRRIRALVATEILSDRFVTKHLGRELGLS